MTPTEFITKWRKNFIKTEFSIYTMNEQTRYDQVSLLEKYSRSNFILLELPDNEEQWKKCQENQSFTSLGFSVILVGTTKDRWRGEKITYDEKYLYIVGYDSEKIYDLADQFMTENQSKLFTFTKEDPFGREAISKARSY